MNWTIIIIETIILIIAFTAMILMPLIKNPVTYSQLSTLTNTQKS